LKVFPLGKCHAGVYASRGPAVPDFLGMLKLTHYRPSVMVDNGHTPAVLC
jgi:hypothetical protein